MDDVDIFRSRLRSIDLTPGSIQWLSSQMRSPLPSKRIPYLVALSEAFCTAHPNQLLALIYLVNDVLQLLRQLDDQNVIFRNLLILETAYRLPDIRIKNPSILAQAARVLQIWRERQVVNPTVYVILESAVHGKDVADNLREKLQSDLRISRETDEEGPQVEAADEEFPAKLKTLADRANELQRNIAEKQRLSSRLLNSEQKNTAQISVLLSKECALRTELSCIYQKIIELADNRQQLLADRIELVK
eukprot:GHVO01065751.1.p1 GENE.GHVO01065751.1~~GHVO01065751.1.p1  ORF type:complete len:247 (+),score=29.55 GHVO01065751.1:495-1235(+)